MLVAVIWRIKGLPPTARRDELENVAEEIFVSYTGWGLLTIIGKLAGILVLVNSVIAVLVFKL